MAREACGALVSISHRPSCLQFHSHVLLCQESQQHELLLLEEYERRRLARSRSTSALHD